MCNKSNDIKAEFSIYGSKTFHNKQFLRLFFSNKVPEQSCIRSLSTSKQYYFSLHLEGKWASRAWHNPWHWWQKPLSHVCHDAPKRGITETEKVALQVGRHLLLILSFAMPFLRIYVKPWARANICLLNRWMIYMVVYHGLSEPDEPMSFSIHHPAI